ncbi:OLC1v1018830C1 [Oldenlandia corymbosa var. corymbosa]|uniref:OLC1v1018830C1 n=1 Tax=Oldenlandia corymbosa var. corymbosa TaxID=529605 RepID=A0AAV1ECI9_OLDCO|nr:OLC1v1018830C1 [Oldenlandia corymbosa var. corymbosa]
MKFIYVFCYCLCLKNNNDGSDKTCDNPVETAKVWLGRAGFTVSVVEALSKFATAPNAMKHHGQNFDAHEELKDLATSFEDKRDEEEKKTLVHDINDMINELMTLKSLLEKKKKMLAEKARLRRVGPTMSRMDEVTVRTMQVEVMMMIAMHLIEDSMLRLLDQSGNKLLLGDWINLGTAVRKNRQCIKLVTFYIVHTYFEHMGSSVDPDWTKCRIVMKFIYVFCYWLCLKNNNDGSDKTCDNPVETAKVWLGRAGFTVSVVEALSKFATAPNAMKHHGQNFDAHEELKDLATSFEDKRDEEEKKALAHDINDMINELMTLKSLLEKKKKILAEKARLRRVGPTMSRMDEVTVRTMQVEVMMMIAMVLEL